MNGRATEDSSPNDVVTVATGERRSVGPYRLESVLGRGAAGVVYRASNPDGHPVAIKVLHPHRVDDGFIRRFQREAEVRIEHENIVQVVDSGVDPDGTPFIVFEFLEGESLDMLMERGSLSPKEVVDIGVQACRGLEAAHSQGVIHRDLKPANLFRCKDGTVKLLDFGMALLTSRATRLTWGDIIVGTPAYLSPEQARGDHELDPQTDIWALGAILYEALSGQLPFDRDTVLATIVAIRMDKLVPLSVCAPTVPPALAAVVERALLKQKDKRWRTAADFRAALEPVDLTPGTPQPDAGESGPITPGESRVVAVVLADGVSDLAILEQSVRAHGGVVASLLHGRAIGVFGGDTWEGDEVVRAIEAALDGRAAAQWMAVASGAAVLAGSAISGAVLKAAESGCAARLEGLAVDSETARAMAGRFELRDASGGLKEVLGSVKRPLAGRVVDSPTAVLLGREAELSQMRRALETIENELRAIAVLITGPPGIGKSRLLLQMEEIAEGWEEPVKVLTGGAESHRRATAWSLLRNLVGEQVRSVAAELHVPMADTMPAGERRQALLALTREALGNDPRVHSCAEFLGELAGVSMPDSEALQAARRDPQLMADRLRVAVQDYFEGLCEQGPVAIFLEDLQWSDPQSLDLLDDLFDRLAEMPLLIAAAARPELDQSRPDLFGGGEVIRQDLRGLTATDVGILANSILKQRLPGSLVRSVTQHTAGNPLFVEQIVMELGEAGTFESDLHTFPLPLTVQAAVQSRLDHLPFAEKQLCKLASVLGRPFFADEVEALGVANADGLLASLCRRNILMARGRSRMDRGRKFSFKTSLTADVAYRMLTDSVRTGLHKRAAAHLAAVPEADHEEVGGHYERGGDFARAAEHYTRAALSAAQRGDTETVLRCSGRALELGAPAESRFELHMARGDALRFRRRWDERGRELGAALGFASNDTERARVFTEQATWLARIGKSAESLATAEKAVAAARRAEDPETLALALGRRISALAYAGRLHEATEAMHEATQLAERMGLQTRAMAASWRAQLASALGDLSERRLAFSEAAALYAETGDIRRAAGSDVNLADVYNRFGAYAEAEARLHAAVEGCRRVGNRLMEGYALLNLGYSLGMLGRIDEALSAVDEATRLAQDMREARLTVATRVYRARVLQLGSRSEEAALEADQAAEEAAEAGLPGLRVAALSVRARAGLATGTPEDALAPSAEAMSLLAEIGSIEEDEAEVFLVRAQALAAAGRHDEAEEVRVHGCRRLVQLAERITDPDWRARFLDKVAAHRELMGNEAGA